MDGLLHDWPSFQFRRADEMRPPRPALRQAITACVSYWKNKEPLRGDKPFSGHCHAYGGSETQDPRLAPFICTQEHAPEQGMVALHRPLHTPISPGLLCNCRAETVPAHRTVITRATKSVALVFLPMIALLSSKRAADAEASVSSYFFGGLTGPGSLTHPPVVPVKIWQMQGPLQGLVALQVPVHAGNSLAFICSCRAETVPAQRTAVATAARNVFLIVLLMIHSSFLCYTSEDEYCQAILPAWLQ
jgi:hypothetical protein